MYIYKNKALTFLEIIISISICFFISTFSFTLIRSMSKTFYKLNFNYKKEKEFIALKSLLSSHIFIGKNLEFRLVDVKNTTNLPSFYQLFNKNSETTGNTIVIKYKFYDNIENKINTTYRCFTFYNNNFTAYYYNEYDLFILREWKNFATVAENFKGHFVMYGNTIKIFIKNLINGEFYEFILFVP